MQLTVALDGLKRWRDFANSWLGELVLWAGDKQIAAAVISVAAPIVALFAYAGKLALDILASLVRSVHGRVFLAALVLTLTGLLACQHFEAKGRALQAGADAIELQKAVTAAKAQAPPKPRASAEAGAGNGCARKPGRGAFGCDLDAGAAISWGAFDTRVSSLEQYRVKAEAKQDVNESRMQEILTKLTAIETQLRIFLPPPGAYGRQHR